MQIIDRRTRFSANPVSGHLRFPVRLARKTRVSHLPITQPQRNTAQRAARIRVLRRKGQRLAEGKTRGGQIPLVYRRTAQFEPGDRVIGLAANRAFKPVADLRSLACHFQHFRQIIENIR